MEVSRGCPPAKDRQKADVFGCCASAASEARRMTCLDADFTSAGFLPLPG